MPRTTARQLAAALENYEVCLRQHGLIRPGAKLVLENGSSTYGRPYRLSEVLDGVEYAPLVGKAAIGFTRPEAEKILLDRWRVLADAFFGKGA